MRIPALTEALRHRPGRLTRVLPSAVLVAVTLRSPDFLSTNSLQVLLASASVFALLATGQLVVILMGRVDLSTGAMAALGTVLLAKWLPGLGAWAIVLTLVFLRLTVRGRQVYAIGLAEQATLMSGVRVRTTVIGAFALSGLAAGLTSMVLGGQQISGDPLAAQSLLLPSIAAVVVGGTPVTGGVGGVGRLIVGVLLVTVLRNGIGVIGIDPSYQNIVYGLVIVAAAALTLDRSKMAVLK